MTIQWNGSGASPKAGDLRSESGSRSVGGSLGRRLLTALVVISLVGAPTLGFAGETASETGRESGLGAAAALSSLVYGPVKLVYATGGLVVGAFAWAFTAGDTEVAEKVFTRSLRGTYVITPDILTGEQELVFIGRDVEMGEASPTEAVASVSPSTTSDPTGSTYGSSYNTTTDNSGYDEMGW